MKVDARKVKSYLQMVLLAIVGAIGAAKFLQIAEQRFPQLGKFTNPLAFIAAFLASNAKNEFVKQAAYGAAFVAGVKLFHQFIPEGSAFKAHIPQFSGLQGLGYPGIGITREQLTLGQNPPGVGQYATEFSRMRTPDLVAG